MKVVAEGVETIEQVLKELGCDYAQGFLIERPMPSDKMSGYLKGRDLVTIQEP